MDTLKQQIIDRFFKHVKNKKFDKTTHNRKHDGAEGHWLEEQMGIKPNASNEPDIFGFEMKKDTKNKTTFGDWSPDISIWKKKNHPYGEDLVLNRDEEFLTIFGKSNINKKGRFSWSGDPVPKIKGFNDYGQKLHVDEDNNILAIYNFEEDQRANKDIIVPPKLQSNNLILAKWSADMMHTRLERKFNNKGWFKCFKNSEGIYSSIGFGNPISYLNWIDLVKKGVVYFDSGMYQGNVRPYAQWRANNNYWDALIVDTHS